MHTFTTGGNWVRVCRTKGKGLWASLPLAPPHLTDAPLGFTAEGNDKAIKIKKSNEENYIYLTFLQTSLVFVAAGSKVDNFKGKLPSLGLVD